MNFMDKKKKKNNDFFFEKNSKENSIEKSVQNVQNLQNRASSSHMRNNSNTSDSKKSDKNLFREIKAISYLQLKSQKEKQEKQLEKQENAKMSTMLLQRKPSEKKIKSPVINLDLCSGNNIGKSFESYSVKNNLRNSTANILKENKSKNSNSFSRRNDSEDLSNKMKNSFANEKDNENNEENQKKVNAKKLKISENVEISNEALMKNKPKTVSNSETFQKFKGKPQQNNFFSPKNCENSNKNELNENENTKEIVPEVKDQDLCEYRKLQEKLNSLENKIQMIKSNISQKTKSNTLKPKTKIAFFNGNNTNSSSKSLEKTEKKTNNLENFVTQVVKGNNLNNNLFKSEKNISIKNNFFEKGKKENSNNNNNNDSENLKIFVKNLRKIYYVDKIVKSFLVDEGKACEIYKEHFIQTMQAVQFSKMLQPISQQMIDEKKIFLSKKEYYQNKKTLIFDLDETLIHCNESLEIPFDVALPIKFPNGDTIQAGVNIRPYTADILKELSFYYEIIVFTASHSCYANVVLDYLDPTRQYIQHRLFRENCVTTKEGLYIKDLRVLANRNLQDVILVDNAAYSFCFRFENGIPIIPFYDNKDDCELKDLTKFLKKIHNLKDLREVIQSTFLIEKYIENENPYELINTIF